MLNVGWNAKIEISMGIDMPDAQQEFRIEEFRQLHEHIRTFETALASIFTVSLVACTTLLTAISGWFFETYRTDPSKIQVALCYLFLSPAFLSMATLALISSHKTAVYRNGYYILVFFEKAPEAPCWHVNLIKYRELAHGEHGNPAALVLWALHGTSVGLFFYSLHLMGLLRLSWHLVAPVALVALMIYEHVGFAGDRRKIEKAWHQVQDPKRVAPPPKRRSWRSVWTALTGHGGRP